MRLTPHASLTALFNQSLPDRAQCLLPNVEAHIFCREAREGHATCNAEEIPQGEHLCGTLPGMLREGEASWALAIPLDTGPNQQWLFKFRIVEPRFAVWPDEDFLLFYHQAAHRVKVR